MNSIPGKTKIKKQKQLALNESKDDDDDGDDGPIAFISTELTRYVVVREFIETSKKT